MGNTVLYMSMSLDGFIAGPNEADDNGLGDGGDRLHEWVFPPEGGVNSQIVDEFMSTGAVVAGRGTFEPAEGWKGDHHSGVPIWVLSRRPAPDWARGMAGGSLHERHRGGFPRSTRAPLAKGRPRARRRHRAARHRCRPSR